MEACLSAARESLSLALRAGSGPTARTDYGIDTTAGDGARTFLCDYQLPHVGIKRGDRGLAHCPPVLSGARKW